MCLVFKKKKMVKKEIDEMEQRKRGGGEKYNKLKVLIFMKKRKIENKQSK